jgi:hypothetical protein
MLPTLPELILMFTRVSLGITRAVNHIRYVIVGVHAAYSDGTLDCYQSPEARWRLERHETSKLALCILKPFHLVPNQKFRREQQIWWSLVHPNIIPLLGYADFSNYGSLISPVGSHFVDRSIPLTAHSGACTAMLQTTWKLPDFLSTNEYK